MTSKLEVKKTGGTAAASAAGKAAELKSKGGMDKSSLESKFQNLSTQLEKDRRAARKVARNKDTIASLLQALNTQPKFTKMVEYGVTCIKGLAVDVTSAIELIDSGVVESLKNVLNLNPYNERIQDLVNQALQALCLTDDLAALVQEKLGCKELIRSMNKHTSPETLISTCKATAKMMRNAKNIDGFVKDGVIDGLANVVKTAKGNADVIAAATACFNRVADDPKNALAIMDSGAVEDILKAMKANPTNKELVQNGLGMLTKLGKASPEILARLKKMGAVDVIVECLEKYPYDKDMLELGKNALAALADKSDVNSALKTISSGDASSQAATANALSKISSLMLVAENVDHMIKNEGIGWLIATLSSAVGDQSETASKILFNGCQALMRCCSDENRIYNIMQKGGVKLLISIIKAHVKDDKVACAALAALTKMVTRKENAVFIVKSGGIDAALLLLNTHPDNAKVAATVLEFFQKLAAHDECVPMLVQAGAIPAIVQILKKFGNDPEIAAACINTLGRMATSAQNVGAIADAGGLEALVNVLNEQKDNLEVCRQAMLLMETMTLVPENIEKLRKLGAMAAILNAMGAHPENAEFQQLGSRLLAKIAGEGNLKEAVDSVAQLSKAGAAANLSKLMAAVNVLSQLTLVDANLDKLFKEGAHNALYSAFEAASKMPASEKRNQLMNAAAAGLLRMCKNKECGAALVKSGQFKKMMQAALANPDNEELAEHMMNMAALLASNPANIAKMVADGAIEDIIALAKQHPLNEKILAAATKALGLLGNSEENIMRIIRAGGAEVVVESIFANMENRDALLNALEVLAQLAINEEAVNALLKAGALDAIIEAMRTHPDDAVILAACCQALCRLLINESVAAQIGEKGAIPLLVKAMRQHYTVEPLCEIDMILMDSLASLPANAKRMLEKELATVELVKWIAGAYPSNTALVEAAAKLLAVLTGPTEEEKAAMALHTEVMDLNEASCETILNKMKSTKVSPNEQLAMLTSLAKSLQNPENARMFLQKGGLQALAAVIKQSKDKEDIFYAASNAFLNLVDNGGEQAITMLEDPACVDALCSMVNAHEMFANPMSLEDLTRAVGCVAKMKLSPATVNEMLKNKPLNSLVKILVQSDDPLLLAQAARLLGKLSNNEEAAALLHKIVNIRELIAAMRRNIKNEEFLKYAVFLLGNLAQNEQICNVIGIEGGIQLILQIMEMYPSNEPLIENCCYALANLTFGNDVNCSFVVACKGIPIIIAAITRNSKAEELLESAVCVLNNLCRNSDPNKDAIVKANGAQAIVDTVLNNFNSLELLLTCFRTLGNLAYNHQTISTIIKAGAVQGIVAGMTVHGEELEVIEIAIKVLTNLSAEEDDENMNILAQEGAVQAVAEVLNQFSDNGDLVLATLGCLCNLARHDENAKIMILQGTVKAVAKALKDSKMAQDVCEGSMRLFNLMSHCTAELDRLIDAKATTAILSALKAHRDDAKIIGDGLGAIANMSHDNGSAERVAQEGAIEGIIAVLNDNASEVEIQSEAFAALSAMSRSEKNAEQMADGSMKAVVAGFKNFQTNIKWLSPAWTFLGNLCVTPAASEYIIPTGLVAPMLLTLKKNITSDEKTLIRGLRALENMAYGSDKVKDHMKREGTEQCMLGIIDASSKDEVKKAARAVIDALNRSSGKYAASALVTIKPREVEKKSAKSLFGDDAKKVELKQEVKNFLLAGQLLQKHSNNAAPRPRHVYVTTDLKFLVWKDPKKPTLDPKCKMKVYKIRSLEKGRCTPQLQRKSLLGKYYAKEECAFAVMGRERTVDLEAKNETERDKWLTSLQALVEYRKALKAQATKFDSR